MNNKDFINWLNGFLDSKEVLTSDLEKIKSKLNSVYPFDETIWTKTLHPSIWGMETFPSGEPISPNQVQISC
jgi:hypothetical protein